MCPRQPIPWDGVPKSLDYGGGNDVLHDLPISQLFHSYDLWALYPGAGGALSKRELAYQRADYVGDGVSNNHGLWLYLSRGRKAFCTRPVTLEKEAGVICSLLSSSRSLLF